MGAASKLNAPYGVTDRGFHRKNIFADEERLLGPDSRVVVDVGAHHGEEIDTYLDAFPNATIHAIEPTTSSREALHRAFGDNGRVRIHNFACAEADGMATLHMYDASECNSLTAYAPEPTLNRDLLGPAEQTAVRTLTLDRFCCDQNIEVIDLLKADTQGAEIRVLTGAASLLSEKRIKLITLEMVFVPLYEHQADADEVIAFLRQRGYHIYDWYNFAYDDNGQVLFGDAIFLPRYVAARGASTVEWQTAAALNGLAHATADVATLQAENQRLRDTVAHLKTRIRRYKTKLESVHRRSRKQET